MVGSFVTCYVVLGRASIDVCLGLNGKRFAGNLTEIWFDGGYSQDVEAQLSALLAHLQPHAVAFGGLGISPSPARCVRYLARERLRGYLHVCLWL